jgi:hypothetical protein
LLGVSLRGEGGRAFWEMIVVLAAVGSGVGLAGRRDLRAVGAAVPAGSCELVSAPLWGVVAGRWQSGDRPRW